MNVIAVRDLVLLDKDGRHKLSVEIGSPFWTEENIEAACSVFIRGLMAGPLLIYGSDLLGALECALGFMDAELRNLSDEKKVTWPGGEAYFT